MKLSENHFRSVSFGIIVLLLFYEIAKNQLNLSVNPEIEKIIVLVLFSIAVVLYVYSRILRKKLRKGMDDKKD